MAELGTRSPRSRLGQGAKALAFGNPLYNLTLFGRAPAALAVIPTDPWPGDAARGEEILAGIYNFAGQSVATGDWPWRAPRVTRPWLAAVHGFEWLRDLRAVGGDSARRQARALVGSWIDRNSRWDEVAWAPDIMGCRIANWIGLHDFFCASADDNFRARVFDSLARQVKHLARVVPGGLAGAELLVALKGLAYGGLCLPDGAPRLAQAMKLLERELPRQILPDGGHVERSPSLHLAVLRHLVDLRAALRTGRAEVPEALQHAIDRMAPALRFYRHGDGGLALFNDSAEEEPVMVDMVLTQADARGRPLKSAPHSGFERINAGRTLVLMDVGAPAPKGLDHRSHAGTLSFEMSVGRERLFVNCGTHPGGWLAEAAAWRSGLRATAAHSTLTLADTNAAEIREDGSIGRRPAEVGCERTETEEGTLLEATHDGYAALFGAVCRRRLFVSTDGEDVRGEEIVEGPGGLDFALRFHLHPQVQASAVRGGNAALLRLPSGQGWRLRVLGGELQVTESLYLGDGEVRRTQQIVVTGTTSDEGATLKWGLRREKKQP